QRHRRGRRREGRVLGGAVERTGASARRARRDPRDAPGDHLDAVLRVPRNVRAGREGGPRDLPLGERPRAGEETDDTKPVRRSRLPGALAPALAVCALASCGRESKESASAAQAAPPAASAQVPAPAPPVENEDPATRTKRPAGGVAPVLWIGMDGLDFEILDRLAAEGKMPNWKRLAGGGLTNGAPRLGPDPSPGVLAEGQAADGAA